MDSEHTVTVTVTVTVYYGALLVARAGDSSRRMPGDPTARRQRCSGRRSTPTNGACMRRPSQSPADAATLWVGERGQGGQAGQASIVSGPLFHAPSPLHTQPLNITRCPSQRLGHVSCLWAWSRHGLPACRDALVCRQARQLHPESRYCVSACSVHVHGADCCSANMSLSTGSPSISG